jgi:hypothetical protein
MYSRSGRRSAPSPSPADHHMVTPTPSPPACAAATAVSFRRLGLPPRRRPRTGGTPGPEVVHVSPRGGRGASSAQLSQPRGRRSPSSRAVPAHACASCTHQNDSIGAWTPPLRSRTAAASACIDKAAVVLGALEAGPATLAQLVQTTGLARPTAHRLAVALEYHRLVARDMQGRFILGPRLAELSAAAGEDRLARRRRARAHRTCATTPASPRRSVPPPGGPPRLRGQRRNGPSACATRSPLGTHAHHAGRLRRPGPARLGGTRPPGQRARTNARFTATMLWPVSDAAAGPSPSASARQGVALGLRTRARPLRPRHRGTVHVSGRIERRHPAARTSCTQPV